MATKTKISMAILFLVFLVSCTPNTTRETDQVMQRSVIVLGEGRLAVRPDLVEFVIVVQTAERELSAVKEKNEKVAQEIKNILKDYDVSDDDVVDDIVRTSSDARANNIFWYVMNRSIKVILRDTSKVDTLFVDILDAGAYEISNVNFTVSQVNLAHSQVMNLAIDAATEKARSMAKQLGMGLGAPIKVEEINLISPNQYERVHVYTLSGLETDPYFDSLRTLAFTEVIFNARVSIEFELIESPKN